MTLEERKEEIRKRADRYIAEWFKGNNIHVRQVEVWSPMHVEALRQFMLDEMARLEHENKEGQKKMEALDNRIEQLERANNGEPHWSQPLHRD